MGSDAQRKERERKSARAGRDFWDSVVPWLGEKRRLARAEEATSPLGHASDCGQKTAARPVGRRGLRVPGTAGDGWCSRGGRYTQICRCTLEPTVRPRSVGAASGWRVFPDHTMLPQPAGATGASDCSPGGPVILESAAAPQDRLSRPAAGTSGSGRH